MNENVEDLATVVYFGSVHDLTEEIKELLRLGAAVRILGDDWRRDFGATVTASE